MAHVYDFHDVARLPAPGDNVAIASRRLEAGTEVVSGSERFRLDHTLLVGHRFARQPINTGAALLSWGLPFGYASRDIAPGTYVCNARILEALRGRNVDFDLPTEANFTDKITPYLLDEARFQPGEQVARYDAPAPSWAMRAAGHEASAPETTSSSSAPRRAPPATPVLWRIACVAWRAGMQTSMASSPWRTPRAAAASGPTTSTSCCVP